MEIDLLNDLLNVITAVSCQLPVACGIAMHDVHHVVLVNRSC